MLTIHNNRNAVYLKKAKIDAVFIDLEQPHFQTVTNGQSKPSTSTASSVNADPQACLQEYENEPAAQA